MKRIIISLISFFALSQLAASAQNSDRLFPYPQPPEDMQNLYERCNYIVYKFWEPADFKSAFSARAKLNRTFGDWLSYMPYASADTVRLAVDRLHERIKKSGQQSYDIAKMAEAWLYSDTAQYRSDELYSMFVDAAVSNKKIPSDKREYFSRQKLILDNSSIGKAVPDLELTKPDGTTTTFAADTSSFTLLFVYEPDCVDCSFARVRLSADMILNQLNVAGIVRIISLYAGQPDADFVKAADEFPKEWLNVASPLAADYIDMRMKPAIYYLDKGHKIIGKELSVDNILEAFRKLIK